MRLAITLALLVGLVSPSAAGPKKPAPKKAKHEPGALVIVLDRSGSMQGPKLDEAKAATLAAARTLAKVDTFALVTFDSESQVMVKPKLAADLVKIEAEIKRVASGGGTNIYPGLVDAKDALAALKLKGKKHVLLLSDGEAPSDGIADLVKEMRAAGITVSTVAVAGADEAMLKMISTEGGGRAYKIGDDLSKLSQVFVEETTIAMK